MNVKIDTKEKFHVITLNEPVLAANMTEELKQILTNCAQSSVKNIVLNLDKVDQVEPEIATVLFNAQQKAYEENHSFVICGLRPTVEELLEKEEMLDLMNITPTESEAWDIVQMEEIERELFEDGSE
ncbi:MAG: anti-anti-sigma factor [Bacteroidetes bacterium]|nr:MAG: anti-anti-sigma factor [Bacteroidota bacterium]